MKCEHRLWSRRVRTQEGFFMDKKTVYCKECGHELHEYDPMYWTGKVVKWVIIAGIVTFIGFVIGWVV